MRNSVPAAHNVRLHQSGTKVFRHPAVGELTLNYDVLDLPADTGLSLTAYTAEPRTPSDDALKLLASWTATLDDTTNHLPTTDSIVASDP